jgi:hypothetical protein
MGGLAALAQKEAPFAILSRITKLLVSSASICGK